ncbi:signal peptidase I [Fusobacterium necrophorum]|uniref:Signal peptidase I n=1 Tax=Fusobacterium necrophorum BL TaxID=1441732 RepID=A0AB73BZH0_9FUSO|nr:signal peptidase I [Fusobacterium necrophorum]AYZ73296.1 signal peptidase I [Fusobacterium necrophorum]AZW08706.1 signal peptidase I [Fusobacterium necrophorum subsp. necrophorum]KDE65274.1 signal peptidase [Fusobacterium necrophorum BL]KDE74385.1 signal peptidase [Fusobacterium necrophorum BFTR-2]SDB10253.1 signal peptidase I [Fusobacterium necrophorum]
MRNHILWNVIVYVLVTSFFLYIWWKQKKLAGIIEKYRTQFGNWVIATCHVQAEGMKRGIQRVIDVTEALVTALILVLLLQHFYVGNFKIPTPSMVPTIEIGDRVLANMVVYRFTAPKKEDVIVFKEPIEDSKNYTKRVIALPGESIKIEGNAVYTDNQKNEKRSYSILPSTTDIPRSLMEGEEWKVPKKGDHITIIPSTNYKQLFLENGLNPHEIQKGIMENAALAFMFLPNLQFYVNGEATGPILDFLHDSRSLNRLMAGEVVEQDLEQDCYFVLGDNTDHSADSRIWGFVKRERITGKVLFRFWPLNRVGFVK